MNVALRIARIVFLGLTTSVFAQSVATLTASDTANKYLIQLNGHNLYRPPFDGTNPREKRS